MRDNAPPKQLTFDLPLDPRYGAEDFLVSPSNEEAYALIEAWPDWPDTVFLLRGPPGSGKSHLASIWATRAQAWTVAAAEIDGSNVSWVPPRHRPTARRLAGEIDGAVTGFVRGQSLVCLILGSFYAVGLFLVGLNFGVLIGMISGFLTFIPYVGTLTGFMLSVGVALVQWWPTGDWLHIGLTVGVFLVGQFLEGNVISPKLVGDSVGLHPVWLMFALLAFGSLFGFLGLLLAVPVAASIGVIVRFGIERYLESRLYRGEEPVLIMDRDK